MYNKIKFCKYNQFLNMLIFCCDLLNTFIFFSVFLTNFSPRQRHRLSLFREQETDFFHQMGTMIQYLQ